MFIISEEDNTDSGRKFLVQRCVKLQKLLILFLFCSGLQQKPPDYDTVVTKGPNNDLEVSLSQVLDYCILIYYRLSTKIHKVPQLPPPLKHSAPQ